MNQMWNEVQPVDRYQVTSNGILHEYDRKVISFLYQPLIGTNCYSLYSTLWNEIEINRIWSDDWTHYHLMNFLGLNLREIYEARLKLEGIGLLKTYMKKDGEERGFIYELQPPLSPEQFFTDGMLNVFLYRQLGHSHFQRMKKFFSDHVIDRDSHKEITRSFQDVFTTNNDPFIQDMDAQNASLIENNSQYISRNETSKIQIEVANFDFELLFAGLNEYLIPRKAITRQVKEAISNLAFLYSINAIEMKSLLLSSLNAEQEIDINDLRKAARDWYQLEHADGVPQLVDRIQPGLQRQAGVNDTMTQEEQLVHYLETTSPRQLLIDISDGAEPSKGDLVAIEEIMFQQQLPPGVVNVLIHYVMLKTDMKLTKNYIEKIASHWARKKVKTVKEAMDLAKNEHRQYQQWAKNKDQKTQRKQPIRKEKLPDWFNEENNQTEEKNQLKEKESMEEKRRRLESIQNQYKNRR
ncbi:replication initiation and membrane attachment family protein [Heyndrickxia oleronia]|uniref:Replication initiation and membrane attachment protein n=1 Tax=Heyndrickxia oleronia TaxID=38875 RepID=A0A8E2LEW7_9BACI|nr:replication initiation and membrane attachment family protein [Heyndrickxia oleronia]NYV64367.1 DnaD domain protein [Bacillus sp. Gen3]OJH17443.1 Replication initiation and membrane attachment protein [Bacillus obstructivus]MBU5212524.1 replication initiation and membrane attachment family protein [Heyndrickxia oleronia]MCI1590161.1 replication initiation and membrane attachment family protein [Heyndrickxia oleronia]MCI1613187.1 replication initiation and membrane attachment family protein 